MSVQVNGTYLFTAHVLGQNGRDVYAWMMMNDRHRAPLHGDGRAGYGGGSQTIILPLRRDDHVWIQLNKDSALLNDYTTFTGHLLFDDWSASFDSRHWPNYHCLNYSISVPSMYVIRKIGTTWALPLGWTVGLGTIIMGFQLSWIFTDCIV